MDEKQKKAHSKATTKYNQSNVKQVKLNLNRKTDADIIEFLEKQNNTQGLIKQLIRNHMIIHG